MPFGIQHSGDKYQVVNKHTGRVLGTHPSEEKAKAQLAAVNINYYKEDEITETDEVSKLPIMIKILRDEYDLACPHCKQVMREKDFTFKYIGEGNGNIWTHECDPTKPFTMPSRMNESYSVKTNKSGFSKEETEPATYEDTQKVKKILDDKKLPETAEEGKAYVVQWADGRGVFACKTKKYLIKWLKDVGSWAEIISIKYGEPKHGSTKLKVLKENIVVGTVDELSTAGDIQDNPTWNSGYFNKELLKSKPIYSFTFDFKDIGKVTVGMFKDADEYDFIDLTNKQKIANIDFKKIDIVRGGKVLRGVEGDYKVSVVGNYRGKGFSYPMYDAIINHNTQNPGMWTSDVKLSPINKNVWMKLIKKYPHEILISNGRTPPLWISITDKTNIDKFGLQHIVQKIQSNPDIIWTEAWDKERIRILLKSSSMNESIRSMLTGVFFS